MEVFYRRVRTKILHVLLTYLALVVFCFRGKASLAVFVVFESLLGGAEIEIIGRLKVFSGN
jgi:hypothetical protein